MGVQRTGDGCWQVRHTFQQGKHLDPDRCEDRLVTGDLLAVIDGATDKSGLTYTWQDRQVSSGVFAAEVVARALLAQRTGTPPLEVVAVVSAALDAAIRAQRPDLPDEQRPSCCMIIFDPVQELLYGVGDCWYALRRADGSAEQHQEQFAVDEILVPMRALTLAALTAAGTPWDPATGSPDPGREAIMPVLRVQGALAHTTGPWGYGVIDGRAVRSEHILSTALPPGCTDLVLASDGYPTLVVDGHLDLAVAEAHLADLLETDPLCVGPLAGTKALLAGQVSYDDRTWLHLTRA